MRAIYSKFIRTNSTVERIIEASIEKVLEYEK